MKRTSLLPGLILIGIGTFFLLKQFNIFDFSAHLTWPIILMIIGVSFIICSLSGWDKALILPGAIVFFIGAHFYGVNEYTWWPSHWSMYLGAVGLGFLLATMRTQHRGYLFPAILLLAFPVVILSFQAERWLFEWWPLVLIIVGLYFILKKK